MNNHTPNFYGLKSQVSYRQAKFRQEACEANNLRKALLVNQTQLECTSANRLTARSGNWLRKLFARLTHQNNPIGI